MVSGLFRGGIVGEENEVSSSIEVDTYNLASATVFSICLRGRNGDNGSTCRRIR